jgi:hypothetical protein
MPHIGCTRFGPTPAELDALFRDLKQAITERILR